MADTTPVLGIRREDKNRWERRAPLAPAHVKELVQKGIKVLVQPSSLRTFSDRQYAEAGAIISEDLSPCSTIIAVKEVPDEHLFPNKTYMFFSHTIKAQPTNMHMLDVILEKKIRLIDYEPITDESGKRLVRFGKFAGFAGMIDTLHALGDRLLALGNSTPFLHLGYSYCYSSLENAKQAVKAMGEEIENFGIPEAISPLTFVFVSEGHVSQGAQEIFKLLPHEWLTPEQMVDLVKNKHKASPYKVYGTLITTEDYVVPNDLTKKFDKDHYYKNPEQYHSVFNEKFAPYISVIMNCGYWDHRYARLITIKQIREAVQNGTTRLIAVGDISCDRMGSIEFLMKTTSIDQPTFIYEPRTGELFDSSTDKDYIYKPGILFCAIDNFPTEFPKEATKWFGDHLLPFLEPIVKSDPSVAFERQLEALPQEISRAVITSQGNLTPKFKYIFDLRKENEKSQRTILILGAGYVAGTAVEYLCRDPSHQLTIVDIILSQAQALAAGRKNCRAQFFNIEDKEALDKLISHHNMVVSLLPAHFHPIVAHYCLKHSKHMVTASYITPELKHLDAEAKAKGLIFLNEIGLDPGIDHCEAKRVIEEVHEAGGKVRSFVSWCGGLPAPEFSNNPLGYKFSWSPRGVLTAATRDAKYRYNGKNMIVPGSQLFRHKQAITVFPGFALEGYPNRDATIYIPEYGLHDASTIFRGTLRYQGWSDILEAFVELGLLSDVKHAHLEPTAPKLTWNDAICILLADEGKDLNAKNRIIHRLETPVGFPSKGFSEDRISKVINCFKWLGMFEPDKFVNKTATSASYLDAFCALLKEKMEFQKHEQDVIILHHIFEIEWQNEEVETRTSTLVVSGDKHGSAMAKTVGYPVAIAVQLLMDGEVKERGVLGPMMKEIYKPLLKTLADEGMRFNESRTRPRRNSSNTK